MQEVFKFVFSHYEAILSVLTLIISVVVLILRKKPVNAIITDLYEACIIGVCSVEKTDLKGADKLNKCIEVVNLIISKKYPNLDITHYRRTIVSIIESILITPQKKEDL